MGKHILIFFIALSIILSCNSKKETYELTMNYQAGDQWQYSMVMNESIRSEGPDGQLNEEKNSAFTLWDNLVKEVDQVGIITLQMTYRQIKMNNYDSEDTSTWSDPYTMVMGPLIGKIITMKSDNKGWVKELTGAEGIYSMGDSTVDDTRIATETAQLKAAIYPKQPVSVGDSWTNAHSISYGYPMHYKNTYLLKGVTDGIASIEVIAEMTPFPDAPPTVFGTVTLYQTLSGTMTGTIELEIESGLAIHSTYQQKIAGTYDMEILGMPRIENQKISAEIQHIYKVIR